ncbi:hypothetical protein HOC99_04710 [Candidatus Woesearchaeota archaeon]|jgi:NMD protein affecting ribosome stability and mRNA decay|nr:hypothetical protein [Candidatus Woesearchaeota archaeon]MBT4387203.1 hypothetical protein [Candidatus Woesearchaeota archaeon]MBT4596205.1 hypothetical protein [Candidatus Woesearchaeota archaeon]MBT5741572.1 hypothetical protein [Candidatus Woesearchaeota archaeon]MBT7962947.1 hypothetical protein [Candidatus Woesearchaeota archaeon]
MKICPKCQKNETNNKFCNFCYSNLLNIILKEKYDLEKCNDCKSIFITNKQYKQINEKTFIELLLGQIRFNNQYNLDVENVDAAYYNYDRKDIEFEIENIKFVILDIDLIIDIKEFENIEQKINLKKKIEYKIVNNKCKECQKFDSEYFEGILQVRFDKKEFNNDYQNIKEKIKEIIIDYRAQINKMVELENGIDFYVLNKKLLPNMGNLILNKIVGEEKISATLFSRNNQTSKDIYRLKYLTKLKNLFLFDYIEYNGEVYQIIKIKKKNLIAKNIINNQNTNLYNNIADINKINEFLEAEVIRIQPNIQILDPIDFSVKNIINESEQIKQKLNYDSKVNIIRLEDKIYIVDQN